MPITSSELWRLAKEWEGLKLSSGPDNERRGEILRLLWSQSTARAMWATALFMQYLDETNTAAVNVFTRMLQSQAERDETP